MSSPDEGAHPALPAQPSEVPWPGERWPEDEPGDDVDREALSAALARAFEGAPGPSLGETGSTLVVHRGRLVVERYARDKDADHEFLSWSVAKSVLHAAVGLLVGEGRLALHEPAPVPAWGGAGDPRGDITLDHLLRMVDGLDFVEDYEDQGASDVIEMLFGSGKTDVAGYTEARPLAHRPGTWWNYSSGTTNVIAAALGRRVGGGAEGIQAFLEERLFHPAGMRSARVRCDDAGTFIGSSFVYATARDFARFGLLYLRDGIFDGARVLPEGWVDHARSRTPASRGYYGAHWWRPLDASGTFAAHGFHGQFVVLSPERDLVVVRHGRSDPEEYLEVQRWIHGILQAFPERAC